MSKEEEMIRADFFVQWAFKGMMILATSAITAFVLNISSEVQVTNDGFGKLKFDMNEKINSLDGRVSNRLMRIETLLEQYSNDSKDRASAIRELQRTIDKK